MKSSHKCEVVLHAGTYKTATSTIQTIMSKNRKEFLADYGILYPNTGARRNTGSSNINSEAHHKIYHATRGKGSDAETKENMDKISQKIAREIEENKPTKIVICTELLSSARTTGKARFIETISGIGEVRVIYAVRRPDEYIESMINQAHKNFKFPKINPESKLSMLNDIEEWKELLGQEAISILAFTKDDYKGYILRTFGLIGVDPNDPRIDLNIHDNPAMTVRGYMLRDMIKRKMEAANITINRNLQHRLNVELDQMEKKLTYSPKATFLTKEMRERSNETNQKLMLEIIQSMTKSEAERMKAELARPIDERMPNSEVPPNITSEDMSQIHASLSTGYLGKIMSNTREPGKPINQQKAATPKSKSTRARKKRREQTENLR